MSQSSCKDNTRLGRIGCGATYSGRVQHSVVKVPWSTYPDGMAHLTFTGDRASDVWWAEGCPDPTTCDRLERDALGRWGVRLSDRDRERLTTSRAAVDVRGGTSGGRSGSRAGRPGRAVLVARLRALGYDGPVSYNVDRLVDLVDELEDR